MSNTEEYIVFRYTGDYVPRNPITGFFEGPIDVKDLSVSLEKLTTEELNESFYDKSVVRVCQNLAYPSQEMKDFQLEMEEFDHRKSDGDLCGIIDNRYSWGLYYTNVYKSNYNGNGITISVLDDGINILDNAFKSLVDSNRILGFNFFTGSDDLNNFGSPRHGTRCSGIICADDICINKKLVRIGIAKGIKKLLVGKISNQNVINIFHLFEGLVWSAKNGADIVSMSFGKSFTNFLKVLEKCEGSKKPIYEKEEIDELSWRYYQIMKSLEFLIETLQNSVGTVFVASAGNNSERDKNKIGYSRFPGLAKNIISIGAIKLTNKRITVDEFQSRGVDFVAPGDNTCSTDNNQPVRFKDTSASTPHAAGIIALWKQALSEIGCYSLENLFLCLQKTAITDQLKEYSVFDIGAGFIQAPTEELLEKLKKEFLIINKS